MSCDTLSCNFRDDFFCAKVTFLETVTPPDIKMKTDQKFVIKV